MTTANINPTAGTDGVKYAVSVPLTPTEADLFGGTGAQAGATPIAIEMGQTIMAVVKLVNQGHILGLSAFVFLQTDLGDGNWIDVAWCAFTGFDTTATFVLCGGGVGAMNNAFQQSRQPGSAPQPQSSGSNAFPIGGRCRFTGFATSSGGSSALSGLPATMLANIGYKLQNPR